MAALETLDKVLNEIDRLKASDKLLARVWAEIGPYDGQVSDELRQEIRKHFSFDDGE